ncbi:MAG TPA: nitroreductase/quinone reductase family protein [Candidatus Limnocylindria bacterium]|nr:nitroreductase/quinone reductase family protein [Candidatus Limnocylindria bacterium]
MPQDWNRNMIAQFHAKHGRGIGRFGDRLLLLTTRGAKSGRAYLVPLAYHRDGERYVIAASNSGAPAHPDWYRNLVNDPRATVEVGDDHFDVTATPIATGPERDRLYEAHAALMPGFRDYVRKTERVIPVVVLERAKRARA